MLPVSLNKVFDYYKKSISKCSKDPYMILAGVALGYSLNEKIMQIARAKFPNTPDLSVSTTFVGAIAGAFTNKKALAVSSLALLFLAPIERYQIFKAQVDGRTVKRAGEMKEFVDQLISSTASSSTASKSSSEQLDFIKDMKNNLKKLHYTPRTEIIDSIACSLNKCEKRNVLIIGNPGSGKTSIVESIVQMQLNKDPLLHSALVDKKFYRVSCVDIMSGSTFRGSLERKIKEMLEFAASDKNIVLVCDEIHQLVLANTDSSSSSLNILEFLKEKLAGDQISIIGMTTEKEYQEHMAGDGALIRRFAKVHLKDPSFEESLQMLKTRGKVFQDRYPDIEPLDDAMYNYILTVAKDGAETSLLDQAFDMLDTAYSSVSYQHNKVITKEIINEICKGSAISKEYEGHKMMYL